MGRWGDEAISGLFRGGRLRMKSRSRNRRKPVKKQLDPSLEPPLPRPSVA
jgi:hypothetical protein